MSKRHTKTTVLVVPTIEMKRIERAFFAYQDGALNVEEAARRLAEGLEAILDGWQEGGEQ